MMIRIDGKSLTYFVKALRRMIQGKISIVKCTKLDTFSICAGTCYDENLSDKSFTYFDYCKSLEADDSLKNLTEFVSNLHCGGFLVHLLPSKDPPTPTRVSNDFQKLRNVSQEHIWCPTMSGKAASE